MKEKGVTLLVRLFLGHDHAMRKGMGMGMNFVDGSGKLIKVIWESEELVEGVFVV